MSITFDDAAVADAATPRRRARRLARAQIDELAAAYLSGATLTDLASRYSIHRTTVSKHLRARGIAIRASTRKLFDQDLAAISVATPPATTKPAL